MRGSVNLANLGLLEFRLVREMGAGQIYYAKALRKNKSIFFFTMFMMLAIGVVTGEYFSRVFTAFDFSEDQSSLDRYESYTLFFQQFEFWGGGVGSTSPAAGRFTNAIGFESLIINSIYGLGVGFSFIFCVGIISWLARLPKAIKSQTYILAMAILPILIGQQLYGIPSGFTSLMIYLFCLLTYRSKLTLPAKVLMPVTRLNM